MTIGVVSRVRPPWPRRRTAVRDSGVRSAGTGSLRTGVERGLVTTLAVVGPLLVLQSLPGFASERLPGSSLPIVSLLLAALPCIAAPIALLRRGTPAHSWLRFSALGYLGLVALERFEIRSPLPDASTPWLLGLSCIVFSCIAIGVQHAGRAVAGCAFIIVGVLTAYAGRVMTSHLVIDVLGLTAVAIGLVFGVRALRQRADAADDAQTAANERFDTARRAAALEEERTRTDALLHDSVLNALLGAASGHEDEQRIALSAESALRVLSATGDGPAVRGVHERFEHAIAAVEHELAPMRELVQLDLTAAHGVELPTRVADTLVAAMLQALSNSIKHAGPMAARIARAVPTGDGGIRLTVRDNGQGFDVADIAPERLGVRVSIIDRVRLVGGSAEIRSAPGTGTTVVLEWTPASESHVTDLPVAAHA
ncbi:sensor histidine kinase [uncultured Amnibacterium sp.]|uniref:sensor histidine kinase n=1 Tax=uncultured Amnibacterium sp. TaxID=1631851 RepID=UPI0035C9EBAF